MPTFNILSLDGGGLRGIIPVRILQKVEELTGQRIHETFDMIVGTSTGGLIAACLTLRDPNDPAKVRYSLVDIADIYVHQGHQIFPIRGGISRFLHGLTTLFRPAFDPDGLDFVLRQRINGQRIKDAYLPLMISTYDLCYNEPVFFKSRQAATDEGANARIHDICRATSAAPTYLPAYTFEYKGKKLTGIDGGVYVNNPTMAAIAEISKHGRGGYYKKKDGSPVTFDDIRILSLGTGTYTGSVTGTQAVRWGKLAWINRIIDIMMRGVNQSTDYESKEMLDAGKYLRLNVDILDKQFADMADARPETREHLEWAVMEQVTGNGETVALLKRFLNGIA